MMPGSKRKPIVLSYNHIRDAICSICDKEDRFMLAVAYANGCRVGEIVQVVAEDIEIKGDFVYVATPVLKKRARFVPKRAPPIYRKLEGWLVDIVLGYAEGKQGRLVSYGIRTAQRRFEKYFECTSHSFRHTRATHCFTLFGMSMREVAEFFMISEKALADWCMRYGHLERSALEKRMIGLEEFE